MDAELLFLCWLGTDSWIVTLLLGKLLLKPSASSDFKMILSACPSCLGWVCMCYRVSQSSAQCTKLGYFLDTPK